MKCRFCKSELHHEFLDLGSSPPSNSFLSVAELNVPEVFYPLKLFVCDKCFLVQVDEYKASDEIFCADYVYFSSFSKSWLAHARAYTDMIVERLKLTQQSLVAEIASNDGYLLQYFQEKEIPCFGIEPSMNVAKAAMDKGLKVVTKFFGAALARKLAAESGQVDLLIGNNVLAHVPDIRDFVSGIHDILQEDGVATLEFPHLMRLVAANQFDTIYHEHYSYLSLSTVCSVFKEFGLTVFDVEELSTHGGSIRIYAGHADAANRQESSSVKELLVCEEAAGMKTLRYYSDFQEKANAVKYGLLSFLIEQKLAGKLVAAYGAAAKGNTLLNYAGVKKDLVSFVVDASPHKQGKFMPGSRIPVTNESEINDKRPDFILILPWNIKEEIMSQLSYIREWGGKFVIPIPALRIEADV